MVIYSDTGNYASLTPIIKNGRIQEVKVLRGGFGYQSNKTSIAVIAAGTDAIVSANIRTWNINLFQRNINTVKRDDGVLDQSIDDASLEYSHIYTPRELRKAVSAISGTDLDNTLYNNPDLVLENSAEITSLYHSPILGWAYDGNPIYGPYGFVDNTGGSIARMKSSYESQVNTTNRPPLAEYPAGFFVEDFVYTGAGDLDVHNGRFCVTPDYPNGTYAYHATIDAATGNPTFPYFIGESYKSEYPKENFLLNQKYEFRDSLQTRMTLILKHLV